MKKAIKALSPGDIFTYAGERFVLLEHQSDGVFCLTEGSVGDTPFQAKDIDTPNDYSQSTLKDRVEEFVEKLIKNAAKSDDLIPFEVDLRPTDMSAGYGTITVKAAPLTLWQYGQYKDLIPLLDDWWWLVTPLWTRWLRSPITDNTYLAWYVDPDGDCYSSHVTYSYGVRPALKLSSDLLVSVDGEDDEMKGDCDNYTVDLSRVSNADLIREVERRFAECAYRMDNEEKSE